MCDEQSITRGASLPSAFRSGRAWNSMPSTVSLVQRCTYEAPGRIVQVDGSGIALSALPAFVAAMATSA
jgi:hypothetical protein